MKFTIVLEEDKSGFVTVSCPVLPGCHSRGQTKKEAIANITGAIEAYIESLHKHGEPIPKMDVEEVEVAAWCPACPSCPATNS